MSALLQELFDGIRSSVDIQRFVDEKREEDLHLEFKTKKDAQNGTPEPEDKKNVSKCLSAFANSDGGVLIWGVKTDHRDQVDRAADCRPITEPEKFRARLADCILEATQPPVDGVTLAVVSANGGAGFVKCLIPASDKTPHMASDNRYYRRTSNGSRQMEHYELEDMFGRRQRPALKLRLALFPTTFNHVPCESLEVGLINEGRVVAKFAGVYLELKDDSNITKIQIVDGLYDASRFNAGRRVLAWSSDANNVIHTNGHTLFVGRVTLYRSDPGAKLSISATVDAESMQTKSLELEIEPGGSEIFVG
jgi:hypothetical protein